MIMVREEKSAAARMAAAPDTAGIPVFPENSRSGKGMWKSCGASAKQREVHAL